MFPKVVKAYLEQGYRLDMGNPSRLYARLIDANTNLPVSTGGGCSPSDALLFTAISRTISPKAIFIIGNAFGLSTFILADIFPESQIDVIDAEIEGADNSLGSSLTRRIAATHYPNVHLTTGYSPQDLGQATRSTKYQFAFVDGLHTDAQMIADFDGLRPILDDSAVVIFHDVALCWMTAAWQHVERVAKSEGYATHQLGFTQFGLCAIVREMPELADYFATIASDFGRNRYHLGVPLLPPPNRPKIWTKSAYQIERYLVNKVRGILGKPPSW